MLSWAKHFFIRLYSTFITYFQLVKVKNTFQVANSKEMVIYTLFN